MAIQVRRNGAWVNNTQEKKRVNSSWVSNSPYKVMKPTISGVPPFTFKSDGENLRDWSMSGQTVQASIPTPSSPVDVSGVGERTGNLFDRTGETVGYYLESDGNLKKFSSNEWSVSDYISVSNSTQYTFTPNSMSGGAAYHVYYDSSKTFISSIASGAGTFTTPNNAAYMRFSYRSSSYDIMLNTGSTAQPYEPYGWCVPVTCGGQTTNIYLGSATSTRRVKKLVLTGEEDYTTWYQSPTRNYSWYLHPNTIGTIMYTPFYCSHGETVTNVSDYRYGKVYCDNTCNLGIFDSSIDTRTKLKNYFAQQYAAGTPVTIWYVLATPETAVVNEPLMKIGSYADEISKTSTGVDIPTVNGSNTLSVGTTVQPSEMSIESISQWV